METINAGNLSKGMFISFKGMPHLVVKTEFMSPGKGSAVMRLKLRNVKSKASQDFTYKTNESVEVVSVDKKEMSFLYQDGNDLTFMDIRNYEQATVPADLLGERVKCLISDLKCYVSFYDDEAIGVDLPPNVALKVVESPDSVAGNRVNAPKKPVKLETGLEIQAPIFIKEGEIVLVDTDTLQYVSRATPESSK